MPSQQGNTSRSLLDQAGRRLLESLETRLFNSRTERFNRLILLLINAAILTLLILPGQQFLSHVYKAGDVASASIKATQDYLLEDAALTEKKRAEAEKAAPYVYDFNPSAAGERYTQFEQSLDLIRRAKASKDPNAGTALRESLNDLFGIELSQAEIGALGRIRRDDVVLNEISRILDRIYSAKIVSDRRLFTEDSIHGVVVVNRENNDPVPPATVASYIELEDAVRLLNGLKMAVGGTSDDVDILRGLIRKILHPNLTFNRDATASRKKEARESVKPVLFQVKRGEMIVREGERIRDDQALKLRMIDESRRGMNRFFLAAGIFGILITTFYFPYRFARKNIRKFNPSNKDLLLLSYITIVFFIILKVGLFLTTAMGSYFPVITSNDYFYLFPFAVGAMLVRIVLNSEIALVYCGICAPLIGVMFESSLQVSIYALMAGIVGAHGVRQCKDRGTIYIAGLKVSVVCVILALTFQILADNVLSLQTVYCLVFAFASGIISAAMVSATVPILETVFQYVTDIKLLELANLNSPVLRELMVKAPGTYHHSVLVGNLVEAAAEAINANPLLARVAAYYHDIGKLSKPMYFIENVASGENKHDKLAPSMSALVLTAHVKEGAEIAKENRLGTQLIDIIKQSHGTSLITFFFQKAKAQAAEGQVIEERDFRYPGPKPQTREAGLVMLADCVEAASRTLNDPTPARIQGMVQKIINNIFIDGQLDECELTLKNLHEIAKSFNCILTGIYHHRIDYPEPAYKERINGGKKTGEDNNREPAKTPPSIDEAHKKSGGEDIKRLGITR